MKEYTQRRIKKLASELTVLDITTVCDCVRDVLDLYKKELMRSDCASYKELEDIDTAMRTILALQDEID